MIAEIDAIQMEVVQIMPKQFQSGVLYVSYEFQTASHLCCCGCGTRVVTPLGLGRWTLSQGQNGPSLSPSIGNTSQPCRSHYFIRDGRVIWARKMTEQEHLAAIAADRRAVTEALIPTPNWWKRTFKKVMQWIRRFLSSH